MSDTEHQFTDGISGRECTLVIPPGGLLFPVLVQPKIGIRHPDCDKLADVSPGLDAFFCTGCGWNGRISGAWCTDKIEAARKLPPAQASP